MYNKKLTMRRTTGAVVIAVALMTWVGASSALNSENCFKPKSAPHCYICPNITTQPKYMALNNGNNTCTPLEYETFHLRDLQENNCALDKNRYPGMFKPFVQVDSYSKAGILVVPCLVNKTVQRIYISCDWDLGQGGSSQSPHRHLNGQHTWTIEGVCKDDNSNPDTCSFQCSLGT